MKSLFNTIVSGPDKQETLRSLAHETRELGGEWLISKVVKLDGRFTAIMRVTVEGSKEDELKTELAKQFPDLTFSHTTPDTIQQIPNNMIVLEIDCLDRPGLTRDISDFLGGLNIQIEHMESTRHPIGTVTSTLYSTRVTLAAPKEVEGQTIADRITSFSGDIKARVL